MPIDRENARLIFRKLDGSDADEVSARFSGMSVEDEECFMAWWAVDPEHGLVFHRTWGPASPQTNSDENVSRLLASKLYPWAEVVQLPYVHYRAHDDGRVWVTTTIPNDERAQAFAGVFDDQPWP